MRPATHTDKHTHARKHADTWHAQSHTYKYMCKSKHCIYAHTQARANTHTHTHTHTVTQIRARVIVYTSRNGMHTHTLHTYTRTH